MKFNVSAFTSAGVVVAVLFLLMLASGGSEAAVARAQFKNQDHPGKCVLDYDTIMSPGQTGKSPNHLCAGVTCMEDGHVEIRTCPAVAPPKGCKMRDFVNVSRDYPQCCERTYDCTSHI